MKKTVGLAVAVFLFFGIGFSFGQEVSAEARRHFDAGRAAAAKATSPEGLLSAIWEFEEASRLAPDWPGAFRGLGLVQRAAKKHADAEKSFRRYLELAPDAADADQIRSLIDEMIDQQGQDAEVQKVYRMMAADEYKRKYVQETTVLSGVNGGYGPLTYFRIESGQLQAWNGWAENPAAYHPKQHPPIPRLWEPVKVNGRFYEYRYSHYMDTAASYVVRKDYIVRGEVISTKPPRLKETVEWSTTWGAPIEGNRNPWRADYNREGVTEEHFELVARDPQPSVGTLVTHVEAEASKPKPVDVKQRQEVESLIAAGGDVNAPDSSGKPPLFRAVETSQVQIIELLLFNGANIHAKDAFGRPLFHIAAGLGDKEIIGLLIGYGADVNAKDKTGWTALHTASANTADLLLAKGADINAKNDSGWTPLFNACEYYRPELARTLIAHGADVGAPDEFGQTPLHAAAGRGHMDLAELLISKGAEVNAKDRLGKTPLDRATFALEVHKQDAYKKMIDLLKKHGAR